MGCKQDTDFYAVSMLINRAIKNNNNLGPTPAKDRDPEPGAETLTHPTCSALGVLWLGTTHGQTNALGSLS